MQIFKTLGIGVTVSAAVIVAALVLGMVLAGTAREVVIFVSGMAIVGAEFEIADRFARARLEKSKTQKSNRGAPPPAPRQGAGAEDFYERACRHYGLKPFHGPAGKASRARLRKRYRADLIREHRRRQQDT